MAQSKIGRRWFVQSVRLLLFSVLGLAAVSCRAAEGISLSPADFEKAMARINALLPSIPVTEKAAEWTRSARISQWTYANSSTYREINTPQAAATRARELKEQGFTVVLLSGAHYRNAHSQPERQHEIIRNARLAAQACQREGIKVLDHNDFTVFYSEGYEQVFAHPEWVQTDVRLGLPLRWFCPNNLSFTQHVIEHLTHFQKETGVDGYMIDEVNFAIGGCGCRECRHSFEQETGYALPALSSSPILGNLDEPLWRLWKQWQLMATARFYARVATALRAIDPDNVQVSYSTAFINPIVLEQPADMWRRAQVVQFPGFEGANVVYPSYRYLVAELNLRRAVAQAWGKYSWAQFPSRSQEEREFSGYLGALTGQAPLFWSNSMAKFFTWPQWEKVTKPRSVVADIGIIASVASRDTNDTAALVHHEEYTGWCQILADAGYQYQPIIDRSGGDIDLSQYRVIIVPAGEALPKKMTERLQAFAAAGGTLIMTGASGMRDANGYLYPQYTDAPLLRPLGMRSLVPNGQPLYQKGKVIGAQDFSLVPTAQGRAVLGLSGKATILEGISYRTNISATSQNTTQLATFDDGLPAVTETKMGQGCIVYLAFLPGHAAYEPQLHMGNQLADWVDPAARLVINGLLQSVEQKHKLTRISGENVIGSVFRSDDGNSAVIHLLNIGGVKHQAGAMLTTQDTMPAYPATGAIKIVLNDIKVTQAHWHTPGARREVKLSLQSNPQSTIVEVPVGALQDYAAIELELRD